MAHWYCKIGDYLIKGLFREILCRKKPQQIIKAGAVITHRPKDVTWGKICLNLESKRAVWYKVREQLASPWWPHSLFHPCYVLLVLHISQTQGEARGQRSMWMCPLQFSLLDSEKREKMQKVSGEAHGSCQSVMDVTVKKIGKWIVYLLSNFIFL